MTVVDASVVVAGLLDDGPEGHWAAELLSQPDILAPHLLPAEVTQIVRRLVSAGTVSTDSAVLALDDLADLAIPLHGFAPYAERVWAMHDSVSAYDAWYVALAESIDAPLATLDRRLARAPGPRCPFLVPPARR